MSCQHESVTQRVGRGRLWQFISRAPGAVDGDDIMRIRATKGLGNGCRVHKENTKRKMMVNNDDDYVPTLALMIGMVTSMVKNFFFAW